jgi:hypothetical protein
MYGAIYGEQRKHTDVRYWRLGALCGPVYPGASRAVLLIVTNRYKRCL